MDNSSFRRFFGALLTILGTIVVLFACVAFLSDNNPIMGMRITKWESLFPFFVGLVFLLSGINLIRQL
ncbi:hypothetical protein GCM10023189_29170 [Nibrella saemangeumensis]|uniref:Tripartite tricarboxylate transporter TctB family protein n=1 Tax=Nibrella saemangeumensis TaxID=1084526 RepID=A0ABP8N085_9BACT